MSTQPPSAEAIEYGLNLADPATLVVDLNCAFASIEQQHDPSLRGRPIAIGAYGVDAATIVSSSREARDLGIKTGMKVFEAKAIYPGITIREPNPPLYRAASDQMIEIMERHSPDVLRMSIDEASMNLAGTPGLNKLGAEGVALAVKKAIRAEIGECVTASVGVSTSIWMAKQASNLDKRDGLQRIDHRNLIAVFGRLHLTDLSGIAEATARRLAKAGIFTPLDFLRATNRPIAARAPSPLGGRGQGWGRRLRQAGMHEEVAGGWAKRLRGFEAGAFESAARKSYSHSHVMSRATTSTRELEELLMRLSDMVGRRLRAAGRRGRVISVGLVYRPDIGHFSRQRTLPEPVSTGDEIYQAARVLLDARDRRLLVGTLGVGLSGLTEEDEGQLDLFAPALTLRKDKRLEAAVDAIRDRFGEDAMQRSRLLGRAHVVRDRIAFGNTGHPDERRKRTS